MAENIKVAVRVRPFSEREQSRQAQLIVLMEKKDTVLLNPAKLQEQPKRFGFDYSYWSHDGFSVREDGYCKPDSAKYTDQEKVFNDLGKEMLANSWKGFNCAIFAYGQTGSGKSYTIIGNTANKGLVPRVCEELFMEIDRKKQPGVTFQVTFSMYEIYNEQVRDLLNKKNSPPGGLVVKESPTKGFFVDGLTTVAVGTHEDIKLRMSEGDRKRTIAATKMNETSSRAHTVVSIQFQQNFLQKKTTLLSSISLVDLAGSERARQSEATGDRFEEAKNINKSLLTLGNVIKALCDQAKGQRVMHVPFRDSVLTELMKNALGGNSKSVMIAAISPDAENYEMTLSTLKYADRAKSIRTDAKVNQAATDKLIQELIAEKERLLKELEKNRNNPAAGISDDEIRRIKEEHEAEIKQYREQMKDSEKVWSQKLAKSREELELMMAKEKLEKEEEKKIPHFSNLNEDPALSGKLVYLVKEGNSLVGNDKDGSSPDIKLHGPRIAKEHARVLNKGGKVTLRPCQGQVLYNGKELTEDVVLHHQDRVRFGSNNLFIFFHPPEAAELKKRGKTLRDITYEYAIEEIAKHSGFNFEEGDALLQQEVMSITQMVNDANAMSEDMDKHMSFAIQLVSAEARGFDGGRTEVMVKVTDEESGNEYLWKKDKFLNRQILMQELYQKFEDNDGRIAVAQNDDPFWEPADTPVVIGVCLVPLSYLAHMVDFVDEPLTVTDYRGKPTGFLKVDIVPCDKTGKDDSNASVEDPMDLVNNTIIFKIYISNAVNLPDRYTKSWCRYKFYGDVDFTETSKKSGKNPKYDHQRIFTFKSSQVDHKLVDHLREKELTVEILGEQEDRTAAASRGNNKEPRQRSDNNVWKVKAHKLQLKLDDIQRIVDRMKDSKEVAEIRRILASPVDD